MDGDNSFYTWDITRIANEWTEGQSINYGVLLKYDQPPSDGSVFDSFFCSTNGKYIDSNAWPQIIYQYVNTTGIEDYYSCHTQDLGYAGTGYTNDLTGNLTIVNPVLQTGGSLMPITVSLVYNTNNIDESATPYGRGWKLNWSQKIDWSVKLYIPTELIHLHGQTVPPSRKNRTAFTEGVPAPSLLYYKYSFFNLSINSKGKHSAPPSGIRSSCFINSCINSIASLLCTPVVGV